MTKDEALDWIKGNRSMTNLVHPYPLCTWQQRIAEANAAMLQQAYWTLKGLVLPTADMDNPVKSVCDLGDGCPYLRELIELRALNARHVAALQVLAELGGGRSEGNVIAQEALKGESK